MFINGFDILWDEIDDYVADIKSIRSVNQFIFNKPVTFFCGENGSGKSTLLEALAIKNGLNPEGGTRNYDFSTYDSYSSLHEHMRLWRSRKPDWMYFLRAESFYNVATKEMDYVDALHPSKEYHEKSHGQSFFSLMMDQLSRNGLYFLDEPEAALSCQNQLALLYLIQEGVKQNCQFIIATHSPILLGFPNAQILSFDDGKVEEVDYKSTSSYQTMKLFLERYDYFVRDIQENSEGGIL